MRGVFGNAKVRGQLTSPIFVVTCMRSFSSLACAMLGQHPELFGVPELNLFMADMIGPVVASINQLRPRSLDGLLRLVGQLEFGEQSEKSIRSARIWLDGHRGWSVTQFFSWAQQAIGRRIIDKSPGTVLEKDRLERMLRLYPDARVLHLTRHPRPTCLSILEVWNLRPGRLRKVSDPEESWLNANLNIVEATAGLSGDRLMHIRGEELLASPSTYLPQICDWLGVGFDERAYNAMLHPENSPFACIGPKSAPFGMDPKFLLNPTFEQRTIPPASLQGALEWRASGSGFSEKTIELAHRFGYR
jgi:hypothetical protein